MTAKQWLLVTGVVILNIVVFGTLLGAPIAHQPSTPTSTWTAYPTFTPMPYPTATAIVMPTLPADRGLVQSPSATPVVHVVSPGETLESIAEAHQVELHTLRTFNHLTDTETIQAGQQLIIPSVGGQ
jgi:nucleoid-associated protein YgaU